MDPSHFGLSGHPFGHDGESANGSVAEAYGALLSELRAGLQAPQGITLLIGEQGSGKSALSRSLVGRLSDKARVVYLPYAGPGLRHLLCESLEQLGVSVKDKDEGPLVEALRELASKRAQNEKATVIIVDEAQDLPAKTLERLAKVFGDDPAEPTMLHMILVGRPELLDRMNAASDRSILKQLVQVCRMDPIEPDDAFDYIRNRIGQAGGLAEDIFTEEAMKSIVQRAEGVPRKLDSICSAVLEVVDEQQGGEIPIQPEAVDLACRSMEGFEMEPGDKQSAKNSDGSQVSHVIEEVSVSDESGGDGDGFTADFGDPDSLEDGTRENRRRLGLWAVGFLAVIAGLAAALTSRQGEDPTQLTVKVPVESSRSSQSAATTAEATRQMSAVAVKRQASVNQTAVGNVPKLKIQRNNASDALRSRRATFGKQPAPAVNPAARPTPVQSNQVRTPARSAAATAARRSTRTEPVAKPAGGASAVAARSPVARPRRAPAASAGSRPGDSGAPARAAAEAAKPPSKPVAGQGVPAVAAPPIPLPVTPAAAVAPPRAVPAPQVKPIVAAITEPVAAAPEAAVRKAVPAAPTAVPEVAPARPGPAGTADQRVALVETASHFAIQLGAFSTAANAEAYRKKASAALSGVVVKQGESGGKSLFRVMVGRYASIDEARAAEAGIKQKGFSTFVRRVSR